ncbi:MAG TPA: aminopeptidase P family protein [Haliscomenobacter sp.]|uniref:aminopeptidase P family protein n=1 Tax=Haliscomenobacter sp. TaxID=2717303 RepID=UPI002BB80CC7|nr:aminopeptidase P family protein [Haliscomenobacter sp.]HOY21040.1 aminopeptidase P family protein [Haliscomenobacter sp.]
MSIAALQALRLALQRQEIAAYIVPSNDPHQSEYVPDYWKLREWLSGFTGSAGTLVITATAAQVWTDGRYFTQAEQELAGSPFVLKKQQVAHAPEHIEWLAENLPAGAIVAADGKLFSVQQQRYIEKRFAAKGIELDTQLDLLGPLWEDRPALPLSPIFEQDTYFAGLSRAEKLQALRSEIKAAGCTHHLICTLEDIAWLLNLRGSDVGFTPVFVAYLIVGLEEAWLFIHSAKVSSSLQQQLQQDKVQLMLYSTIDLFCGELSARDRILIDAASCSNHLYQQLSKVQIKEGVHLVRDRKAVKNHAEIYHFKSAMRKDGVALLRAFRWLEAALAEGENPSEYDFAQKIGACRAEQSDYFSESFPAIIGYNGNGAIIHYRPSKEGSAKIQPQGILLVDSGAQYLDGTTDITRTIALSEPTAQQRLHYTLVLKGMIALSSAVFLKGTIGMQLDALARQPLWQHALNYNHGTGHGVGAFLSVHEPPHGFASSATTSRGTTALEVGHICSNEPGFYLPGEYGIRIENLILCAPKVQNEYGDFLHFETLTLFPIDTKLLEKSLLNASEIQWLNAYHKRVLQELGSLVEGDELKWLEEKCAEISFQHLF